MKKQQHIFNPTKHQIKNSNIAKSLKVLQLSTYEEFYTWSDLNREDFWKHAAQTIGIKYNKEPKEFLNLEDGIEEAHWLKGARINIIESIDSVSIDVSII